MLCKYCIHKDDCTKIISQRTLCKDFSSVNYVDSLNANVDDIFYVVARFDGMQSSAEVTEYKVIKVDSNYITGVLRSSDERVWRYKVNKVDNIFLSCREDAEELCVEYNKITDWD